MLIDCEALPTLDLADTTYLTCIISTASLNHKYVKSGVHAFFIEMFGAAVLGFVVFTLTNPRNPIPGSFIPIVIGLTYGVLVATLGPLTGYVAVAFRENYCDIVRRLDSF